MSKHSKAQCKSKCKIMGVEPTDERITGRGGLSLFVNYLENIQIFENMLLPRFGSLRKSKKGASIYAFFMQLLAFFMDATSRHLSYFDQLRKDKAYAGVIGTKPEDMLSSHAVKRIFAAFSWPLITGFRHIHLNLFLWRLQITKPEVIVMDLDAMIMDNDQAERREGVKPTYKKRKGFNALQLTWEGLLVDSIFRSGEKHSNSGRSVQHMIRQVVECIRSGYSGEVPIIIHMDSGYLDQKIFAVCEKLGIGYICGGKLYKDITGWMARVPAKSWKRYFGPGEVEDSQIWEYVEFGDRRETWGRFRRAIFTRPMSANGQLILPFVRPCNVIYTNLGHGSLVDEQLKKAKADWLLSPEGVIRCYHDRGRSELTFRSFKDFGSEQLPFKKFKHNAAFYHCMVLAFNLYEAFKEDVCRDVVPVASYPETLRRKVIDIGAKLIKRSRKVILKIPQAIFDSLDFKTLWARSSNPPRFALL